MIPLIDCCLEDKLGGDTYVAGSVVGMQGNVVLAEADIAAGTDIISHLSAPFYQTESDEVIFLRDDVVQRAIVRAVIGKGYFFVGDASTDDGAHAGMAKGILCSKRIDDEVAFAHESQFVIVGGILLRFVGRIGQGSLQHQTRHFAFKREVNADTCLERMAVGVLVVYNVGFVVTGKTFVHLAIVEIIACHYLETEATVLRLFFIFVGDTCRVVGADIVMVAFDSFYGFLMGESAIVHLFDGCGRLFQEIAQYPALAHLKTLGLLVGHSFATVDLDGTQFAVLTFEEIVVVLHSRHIVEVHDAVNEELSKTLLHHTFQWQIDGYIVFAVVVETEGADAVGSEGGVFLCTVCLETAGVRQADVRPEIYMAVDGITGVADDNACVGIVLGSCGNRTHDVK